MDAMYRVCWREVTEHACKGLFQSSSCLTDEVIPPVERVRVGPDQLNVCYDRSDVGVLIRIELALDLAEVHGRFDDIGVMRNVEHDDVDGSVECLRVFAPSDGFDGGLKEFDSCWGEGLRTGDVDWGGSRGGCEWFEGLRVCFRGRCRDGLAG